MSDEPAPTAAWARLLEQFPLIEPTIMGALEGCEPEDVDASRLFPLIEKALPGIGVVEIVAALNQATRRDQRRIALRRRACEALAGGA